MSDDLDRLFEFVQQIERRLDAVEKKVFCGNMFVRFLAWLFGLAVGLVSVFFGVGGK